MTRSAWKWTTGRSAFRTVGAILALSIGLGAPAPAEPPATASSPPMTNEDVVRMAMAHLPISRILEAIRSAPAVEFDLDPDVVIELRRAGVPDTVVTAMTDRMKASAKMEGGSPPVTTAATGVLELSFDKIDGGAPARSTAVVLAKDWNDRPVSLAFFVYCFDPLHVPDLWDTKTPLKIGFPRHDLLWFHEATQPWRENRRGGMVYLDLPEKNSIPVPTGTHPLELGVVSRTEGLPWKLVASTEATIEIKEGMTSRLALKVSTRRAGRLDTAAGGEPAVTCTVVKAEPPGPPSSPSP